MVLETFIEFQLQSCINLTKKFLKIGNFLTEL